MLSQTLQMLKELIDKLCSWNNSSIKILLSLIT